ncbi:immunity protein Imm1 of predicted polymorphic toxin system [Halopolyspora algeriensis]|uniref:Immunity protein Imm1 of predicted polymorphic toxin system n=2 Tax=Halopolyspora algeriensis TaxID=1500506 RepID=A0A368VN16_9ACTN|nr:immunity protein Imm1 of predicted polymorphic toxin system [Halopolyspora algeriensis]TQM53715.1 immunity protein Imm1 of predicted polymorphic toxin system [Halopolyspora algeriensis]
MSNPLSQDESGPREPSAEVFARLADVPLESIDKLIETTESAYTDLNKVRGHPYWGDLVLQQSAALRALNEARDGLDGLRAEAIGARNTELGITVTTAVIDGKTHCAERDDEKPSLVDRLLRPEQPGRAGHLYVWDRPYDNDRSGGPYQQIRVVTAAEEELGVLNYTEETEEGELLSWHTYTPRPPDGAPVLRFDAGSPLAFPRDAVLPLPELRAALSEFTRTGLRPESVQWQRARWGD